MNNKRFPIFLVLLVLVLSIFTAIISNIVNFLSIGEFAVLIFSLIGLYLLSIIIKILKH